jgi:HD-GYP domain-containing protein (c-di-GMP phosphodiesterase class II)
MAESDYHEALNHVLAQLTVAVTNTSLYSLAHPKVTYYTEKAYAMLQALQWTNPEITFLLIGDDLLADNRTLPAGSGYVASFIRVMKKKSVERLTFVDGMSKAEFQGLIRDLASHDTVSIRSSPGIKLGKVELRIKKAAQESEPGGAGSISPAPEVFQQDYQELLALTISELDELKEIYFFVKRHQKIDVQSVDDMVRRFIKGFRQEINPLAMLSSIKSSDEYTFTHVANVCILTMSQAEHIGLSGKYLHDVGVASLLHDVGKMFIPDEIINKPAALTPAERRTIETHPVKGARYLIGIEGIPKLAILSALEHHKNFDGSGYPSIRGGWTPHIASQMISIADVFDAMRSRRSYREPVPLEKIEDMLRKGSGTSFNPQLVNYFLKLIHQ